MKNRFSLTKISFVAAFAASALAPMAAQATTTQFLTRLYTEALGRSPEEGAWPNFTALPQSGAACTSNNFLGFAKSVYTSAEYQGFGYSNLEKVLTLYRGILSRDPESQAALNSWVSNFNNGMTMDSAVTAFISSAEFTSLRNNFICSTSNNTADPAYRWANTAAITVNPGEVATSMTGDFLQNLLNTAKANGTTTVALNPHTVIYVSNKKITIPAGITLTTQGVTNRQHYAKMARIVRTGHFGNPASIRGDSALISMESGSKLNAIWVSGQREALINGSTLPYSVFSANIFIKGGNGTQVTNSRIDSVAGNTNIIAEGSAEGTPCASVTISNNLLTGYNNTHYTPGQFSDGITASCEKTVISYNQVVDASDVGIILFRSTPAVQSSRVYGNYIISSGISGFAAMGYEPWYPDSGQPIATLDFTGATFDGNLFWSGPDSHFDIGISGGTKAWNATTNLGKNGSIVRNTNAGIPTTMQIGIAMDGMIAVPATSGGAVPLLVSGNNLSYKPQANGTCRNKAAYVSDYPGDATRASISPLPTTPAEAHSCAMSPFH